MKQISIKDSTLVFTGLGIFFTMVVSANILLIYFAVSSADGLVEENYYKRGLNYQEEKLQGHEQEKLGWNIKLQKDHLKYTISAIDKKGKSISNAKVKLTFFRPTKSGYDQTISLKENKDGVYEKSVDLALKGIWDVYIKVEKEKNIWKNKQRIIN